MEERNSKLAEIAEIERIKQLSFNSKNKENEYGQGHPDAVSDGDVHGKGLNNGQVGSSDDIRAHNSQMTMNKYGPNNEYH